jgi:hypothetical protein
MLHIQQQGYATLILNNMTMHAYLACIIHGNNLITN